jgi:hypothetical protein
MKKFYDPPDEVDRVNHHAGFVFSQEILCERTSCYFWLKTKSWLCF